MRAERRPLARAGVLLLLALTALLAAPFAPGLLAAADEPPPVEKPTATGDALVERGRLLYVSGTSPTGEPPTAVMGDVDIEIPAAAIPCASCHGPDGRGRPEGGIAPSDVTWGSLTDPRGGESPSGRRHPPYDAKSLVRAVTMGVDPAGNELDVAMPRYRLSHADAEALVAYLRQLGSTAEAGVADDAVVIGTLLPPAAVPGVGAAVVATLVTAFDDLAGEGGVYGRRLELVYESAGETPAESRQRLAAFLDRERPFALVAPFFAGADEQLIALAEEREIPVIGPWTAASADGQQTPPRYVFHLASGAEEQARALAAFAAGRRSAGLARWATLAPELPTPESETALAGLARQAEALRLPAPQVVRYRSGAFDAAALVPRLRENGAEQLFVVGGGLELTRLLTEAARIGWAPEIYVPERGTARALLDGTAARSGFTGEIHLAFPLLPQAAGASAAGREEIARIVEARGLEPAQIPAVQHTLAATQVLIEGMRRTGRRLTREGLVESLDTLYTHPTGLLPAISYNPNRRIGALGAYVVRYDPGKDSVDTSPGWIALSEK